MALKASETGRLRPFFTSGFSRIFANITSDAFHFHLQFVTVHFIFHFHLPFFTVISTTWVSFRRFANTNSDINKNLGFISKICKHKQVISKQPRFQSSEAITSDVSAAWSACHLKLVIISFAPSEPLKHNFDPVSSGRFGGR